MLSPVSPQNHHVAATAEDGLYSIVSCIWHFAELKATPFCHYGKKGNAPLNRCDYFPQTRLISPAGDKSLILAKYAPMFETPDDLILSYGSFFHLTTPEIWEVIQLEGLIPQHTHL